MGVTKKIPKIQISTTMKNDVSPKTKYMNNFKNSSNSDKKSTLKLVKSPKSPKSTKKLSKLELMILERQEKIEKESIKIKEKRMKRISLILNKSNKNHTTFYKHTNNSKQKKILLTPNLEKELVKRNNDIQRDINLQPKHLKNNKNKEIKKKKPTKPIAFNFSCQNRLKKRIRTQSVSPRKIILNIKKLKKKIKSPKKYFTPKKTKPI